MAKPRVNKDAVARKASTRLAKSGGDGEGVTDDRLDESGAEKGGIETDSEGEGESGSVCGEREEDDSEGDGYGCSSVTRGSVGGGSTGVEDGDEENEQASSSGDADEDDERSAYVKVLGSSIRDEHHAKEDCMVDVNKKEIRLWVRKHGFKKQKFVVGWDYGPDSPLFRRCIKECLTVDLGCWDQNKDEYFRVYGTCIRRTLNHKRNCCQSSIRVALRELFRDEKLKKDQLHLFKDGPKLDKKGDDGAAYEACLDRCLRIVVGDSEFVYNIAESEIPSWANSGDEALTFLLIENCWNQECDVHFEGKKTSDDFNKKNDERRRDGEEAHPEAMRARPCKWSCGTANKEGGGKVQGWTKDGLERYNVIRQRIVKWRASAGGKKFYGRILEKHKKAAQGKNKRKRSFEKKGCVKVQNDWSDDEVGETTAV